MLVVNANPGRFSSGNVPVPIVQEAEWAPGPVWTGAENLLHRDSIPRTVQPVQTEFLGTFRAFSLLLLLLLLLLLFNFNWIDTRWQ
jgi:hypothetical protein